MKSGDTDPWSGDDVPVAPGLGEIVWDTPSARAAADGIDAETVTGRTKPSVRRLFVPAMAVSAVALLLLAVFAWPERSSTVADDPASSDPATPTTLDILPPATTSAAPTTVASAASVVDGADSVIEAAFTGLVPGELPAVLATAEVTTEVLTVTNDGELVTLSLPDGTVTERVDLGLSGASRFSPNSGRLIVSPTAAMYAIDRDLYVAPSGGDVVTIDPEEFGSSWNGLIPFGWTSDVDGATVFVVLTFDEFGLESEWLVNNSGEVSPAPAQRSGSFARPIFSLGTRFIDDAGGVYRVDPNGDSNRISSGNVLATSETHLLLRECNANRVCNAVLRDYQGEEVRVVTLPPSFNPGFFAASLSPGSGAVAFTASDFSGDRIILDLDTSETLVFTGLPAEVPPPTWAAQGAGIFVLGSQGGLRFLDRVSGDDFSFALGLGDVLAIATRTPAG